MARLLLAANLIQATTLGDFNFGHLQGTVKLTLHPLKYAT